MTSTASAAWATAARGRLACGFAGRAQIGKGMWAVPLEAARSLIVNGFDQHNGYTEPVLHAFRRLAKRQR